MVTLLLGALSIVFASCGGSKSSDKSSDGATCTTTLTGTPWVPSVSGVSQSNRTGNTSVSKTVIEASGVNVVGLAQGTTGNEVSLNIDMTQDLGTFGSLQLIAQTTNYPSSLAGGAFPLLVSLHDGVNEYINLSNNCKTSGFYTCSSGSCTANSSCSLSFPSVYKSRSQWELRQGILSSSAVNSPSVNTFPTCGWSGGSGFTDSNPACPFVSVPFFPSGTSKLRFGGNYTAKYVLMADSYTTLSNKTAGLKVTVVKKTSTAAAVGGAIDLNVILVGSDTVQASRTTKGKQNLNTLMKSVVTHYGQANANIKFGAINAVEWPCESGGDTYSTVDADDTGAMFAKSSNLVSSSNENKALNIFMVNKIEDSNSSFTVLGLSGGIGGPLMNGTTASGLAISTFGALATLNPDCPANATTCSLTQQEDTFFQMTDTASHEIGHTLGLNHPSESNGQTHDFVPDTPICTTVSSTSNVISINSCRTLDTNTFSGNTCSSECSTYNTSTGVFCPAKLSCQFNYMMWWSSKNFKQSTGSSDGEIFSAEEGRIMTYHPFVQ